MSGTAQNDEKYKNSLVRLGKAFWQLPCSHTPWPHLGNDHSPKLRRRLMWLQFGSLSNIITKICFWLAHIVRLLCGCGLIVFGQCSLAELIIHQPYQTPHKTSHQMTANMIPCRMPCWMSHCIACQIPHGFKLILSSRVLKDH